MFNKKQEQQQQPSNRQELENLNQMNNSEASSDSDNINILTCAINSNAARSDVTVNDNPIPPSENTSVFKQLFATLEAEHQKLQGLELRRIKLTEEMKNLREMLQQENRRLRSQSQEPASYSAATSRSSTSLNSSKQKSAKKSSNQVEPALTEIPSISDGLGITTLEHNATEELLVSIPLGREEQPRPQVAELVIEMVDSNSAMRQLQTIESSSLWHAPVTSVDMETFLQMSNISAAQSRTNYRDDQDSAKAD